MSGRDQTWASICCFWLEQLGGVFEFFVFNQAIDEFGARVALLFRSRPWDRRGATFLDLMSDERSRHVDEIGRDVDVELLELVKIIEILAGDLRDGDVVNVHLLLANQIEQQVQRALVRGDVYVVGRVVGWPRPSRPPSRFWAAVPGRVHRAFFPS